MTPDDIDDDQLEALHVQSLQEALELVDVHLYRDLRTRLIEIGIDDPLLINLSIIELETTRVMQGQATLIVDYTNDARIDIRVEPQTLI